MNRRRPVYPASAMTTDAAPAAPARPPALTPRDAATLIIVRRDAATPRVLMGKRHESHKFMPGKFVFPGGRVDLGDCRLRPGAGLDPRVEAKLLARMRARPSPGRARGIAMAAVRETFEEVGLVIGRPSEGRLATSDPAWSGFVATGHAPDLSSLRLFARAITPPGRTRRFDTRFLVADAEAVRNLDAPVAASEELLDPYWVTIADAQGLDLPWITREVLRRLDAALARPDGLEPDAPLTFQYMRGKTWRYETL